MARDWEQREFGKVVNRSTEMACLSELPRVEYEDIISGIGLLNKDITKKQSNKSGLLFSQGDVLYGKLRPYLKNWLIPSFSGIAVGDFWVLKPENSDSGFIYRLIQTKQFDNVANQSTGTKMPRADWKLVSNTMFYVPILITEQVKIGRCFSVLDNLITLHQCKDLQFFIPKKYKMLFGFCNQKTTTWEQCKLGEITNSYSGGTPTVGNHLYYGGDIPFIRSAEINSESTELFITEIGLKNSSAKMIKQGDILYALYGATSGEVGRSRINGAINQAILAIIPCEEYDAEYLAQWLRKSKSSIIETYLQGGQGNLSGAIVKELEIDIPELAEQLKIGNILYRVDNLITLHQRVLINFKEHFYDKRNEQKRITYRLF